MRWLAGRGRRWVAPVRRAGASLLSAVAMLLAIATATFGLMQLAPGGPLAALGGNHGKITRDQVRALTRQFLLDEPWYVQLGAWLSATARGNLGYSIISGAPVSEVVAARILPSLQLFVAVAVVTTVVAWPLGLVLARREGGLLDRFVLSVTGLAQGVPAFWLGVLAIYALMSTAGPAGPLLPIAGNAEYGATHTGLADTARHLVLPTVTGAMAFLPYYIRVIRALAVSALQEDYVQLARTKGVPESLVLARHVGKNIAGPWLAMMGADLPAMLTGLVAVEKVFSWPGLGQLLTSSAARHDYPVVLAITLLSGAVAIASMRLSRLLAERLGAGRRAVRWHADEVRVQ